MPLKRHKALIPLSQDHHNGLILAQLIKKNAPPYRGLPEDIPGKAEYTIRFHEMHLIPHFAEEEHSLFPLCKGRNIELDTLVTEIINEHKQMTLLVDFIRKKINLEVNLNELGELLAEHIRKEERELFPKIQEMLSDEELEKVRKMLERPAH